MKESKELTTASARVPSSRYDDKAFLEIIRRAVAPQATDTEFDYFVSLARETGLSPVKKEIWFIVTSPDNPQYRKCMVMVGFQGFFTIANWHPQFDGIEYEYGPEIVVNLPKNSEGVTQIKTFEWIETVSYRRDRSRPQRFRAFWDECAQELVSRAGKLTIWGKRPKYMLTKSSESMNLKRMFPSEAGGLYSEAEMPADFYSVENETAQIIDVTSTPQTETKIRTEADGSKTYAMGKNKAPKQEQVEEVIEAESEEVVAEAETDDVRFRFMYSLQKMPSEKVQKALDYIEKMKDSFPIEWDGDILKSVEELKLLKNYQITEEQAADMF